MNCRGRMVVELTTTCAIIAYHHLGCEFETHSWRGVLDKTLCDKVCGFLWVLQFPPQSSNWNIFESCVKHLISNGQMMDQTFVYIVHNIKHLWIIMWELSVGLCPKNIYFFWIKFFFHFRSSIDRPLNPLPPYPCRNNYFSIPEENM